MAYDAYGRPLREADYINTQNHSEPLYSRQYTAEPRNTDSSFHQQNSSSTKQANTMSVPERSESTSHDVSPELIAAITERVKKERMLLPRTSALHQTHTDYSHGASEADWHTIRRSIQSTAVATRTFQ